MKTERRHELQTNVLADVLGKQIQQVKPYSMTILAVVILVLAVAIAGMIYTNNETAQLGSGWSAYYGAFSERDAEQLDNVATSHAGTTAGLWAKQSAADIELANGAGLLYRNRDLAEEGLLRARDAYEAVQKAALNDSLLRLRARYGLAQTYECLSVASKGRRKNRDDLAEARKYYELVVKEAPDTALGVAAKQRIDQIDRLSPGEWKKDDWNPDNWYSWLAQNEPPAVDSTPGAPRSSQVPSVSLDDLPDLPDFPPSKGSPPDTPDKSEDPSSAETPDKSAPEQPDSQPPAEPAEESADKADKSSEEKPKGKAEEEPEEKAEQKPEEKAEQKPGADDSPEKPAADAEDTDGDSSN